MIRITSVESLRQKIGDFPLVLVYFMHDFCPSCPSVGRFLEALEPQAREGGWVFIKFDVTQDQRVGREFNVYTAPTVLLFRRGEFLRQFVGGGGELRLYSIKKAVLDGSSGV